MKECTLIKYSENPKEYMKQYYILHKELIKRRSMETYLRKKCTVEFRERRNEYNRQWKKNNAERFRNRVRKYYHMNRENFLGYMENRRARKISAGGKWTRKDIRDRYTAQNGRCLYCCKTVEINSFHTDHMIPLSKGGSNEVGNLAIACETCNVSKSTKSVMDYVLRLVS